jgi:hypothetical protein
MTPRTGPSEAVARTFGQRVTLLPWRMGQGGPDAAANSYEPVETINVTISERREPETKRPT